MVSQTGLRVVRSNSFKGPSVSWKRAKKEPKGQSKILGPASVICDHISEIWPQKGQPGNPESQLSVTIICSRDDHVAGVPEWTPAGACILSRSRSRSRSQYFRFEPEQEAELEFILMSVQEPIKIFKESIKI